MNDIVRREEKIERLQRFQSLKAGAYWKATEDITEEAINAGDTLLLMSIRWVDNQAHTIILRAHPRHFDEYVIIEVEGPDGKLQKNHKRMVEHRFLVQDFLNKFEFEPNHTQIRQTEIASVHAEIHALQQVMDDAMTKPEIMKAIVDTQLAADEENEIKKLDGKIEKPLLPAVFDEVVPVVTGTVQNALSMGGEAPSMDVMKQALNREKRIAVIQTKWLENQKQQINNIIKKLMPYFNEMPAAALAMSEDVREHVDKLESGIKSMLLYTGEHVEIVPVKKGKSASSDIPLTLVQKKLIVEEELAVWADIDEWFDFRSENLFFKALNEHPELVTQIFPSERCVLVMAMTNHDVNYGEPWSNEENNKRNRRVFLMVRDGENIYQVFSPVESHLGSSRLFPARDEGEAIFRGLDGSQIKFDDVAYTDRLKGFDLRALHYKRFLILICGLDHREKLFGDFYDEPQSLDFISMRFQEDYCRFLHDEDGSGLLAAHDDRPSLNQYIMATCAQAPVCCVTGVPLCLLIRHPEPVNKTLVPGMVVDGILPLILKTISVSQSHTVKRSQSVLMSLLNVDIQIRGLTAKLTLLPMMTAMKTKTINSRTCVWMLSNRTIWSGMSLIVSIVVIIFSISVSSRWPSSLSGLNVRLKSLCVK
ncbi:MULTISPECIES: hypothetical protein [Providencia]|uniref:Uncharacterized protein n=1 Tax=Providencia huaxiensis TaxID=2027290 RepID=A0ABU2J4H3_9GAMM|nr:hypothetical protein [Providencia huaxiensis]MDT0135725.1 hypothetical protein [Providencia huaxiensis]MDT1982130.1 hypothetical protein [Providencia huaxiensis]